MPNDPQARGDFPSTRWSLVIRARDVDPQVRRDALDQLLRAYSPALTTYLIVGPRRFPAEAAEEIVQSFLVEKVLQRDLLSKADPTKGKLRSLVVKSLKNYVIDLHRQRKLPGVQLDDAMSADLGAPASIDNYNRAWAREVLNESMRKMCSECLASGRTDVWAILEARVVRPALEGASPVEYESLVRKFGFASPEQAANALVTAKRHFRRVLENVVAQYADDDEIDNEICDLRAVLAAAGPLGVLPVTGEGPQESSQGNANSADESSPLLWSMMLNANPDRDDLWTTDELSQLLAHQLRQPLADILTDADDSLLLLKAKTAARKSGEPLATLGDLFRHSAPPLELLDAAKRWARRAAHDDASQLPSEVSSLIYFSAIAAALVRHNARITKSDNATLRFGFERLLTQRGADEQLSFLIRSAVGRVTE